MKKQFTASKQTLVKIESCRQENDKLTNKIRYYIGDEVGWNTNYFNESVHGRRNIGNH
ncbi:MAG: hypothetical protein LBI60_02320 [Bacteroidales bacterium]|jgi:hypothetical protein|nr:hypothetical protein [Bacteroidales bacterium]